MTDEQPEQLTPEPPIVRNAAYFRAEQADEKARARWSWPVDPELYFRTPNGMIRRRPTHPKGQRVTRSELKAAKRAKVRSRNRCATATPAK